MRSKASKPDPSDAPAPAGAGATVSTHRGAKLVLMDKPYLGHPRLRLERPGDHTYEASLPIPGRGGARAMATVHCPHGDAATACATCEARALEALANMVENFNWRQVREALGPVARVMERM